jgi:hypothetical protein
VSADSVVEDALTGRHVCDAQKLSGSTKGVKIHECKAKEGAEASTPVSNRIGSEGAVPADHSAQIATAVLDVVVRLRCEGARPNEVIVCGEVRAVRLTSRTV